MQIGDNVSLGGKIKQRDNTGPYEVLGKGNVKISYKGKPTVAQINRLQRSRVYIQK